MAYDGKVMRAAWQRFEEDKQRRAAQRSARRQTGTLFDGE